VGPPILPATTAFQGYTLKKLFPQKFSFVSFS
jgi:hypothetical protein